MLFIETVSSPFWEERAGAVHFISEHIQWSSLVLERLREHRADLVVAVAAPRCSSAENFLRWLVKNPIGPPTLAVLPPDNDLIQLAAQAVDDFIVEPIHSGEWHHRVARLLANDSPDNNMATTQERETRELGLAELVGNHPAFLRTIEQIPLVARNNSPVLITGETGTGKLRTRNPSSEPSRGFSIHSGGLLGVSRASVRDRNVRPCTWRFYRRTPRPNGAGCSCG